MDKKQKKEEPLVLKRWQKPDKHLLLDTGVYRKAIFKSDAIFFMSTIVMIFETPNRVLCFLLNSQIEYKSLVVDHNSSPGSPDRQFCSSTSAIGDISSDSLHHGTIKEELPR